MPSKSKKQAKLMRAVAAGWKPTRIKGPTKAVAKEFVKADKRREGVKGYQRGGNALGVPGMRRMPPNMGGGALSRMPQKPMQPMMGGKPSPMMGGRMMSPPQRMPNRNVPRMPMGRGMQNDNMPTSQRPMQRSFFGRPNTPTTGGLGQVGNAMMNMKERAQSRVPGPVTAPPRNMVPNTMYGGRNPMMSTASRFGMGMPRRSLY